MSYILDALKRADAERERGAVPGLHAQQNAALAAAPLVKSRTRIWLASGAVVILSAVAVGLWLWRAPANEAGLPAMQLAMVPPLVGAPPATPIAAPIAATPTPTPAPAPKATPKPAPAPVTAVRIPVTPAPVAPAPVAAPAARATSSKTAAPAKAAVAPEPAPAVAAVIPLLGDLPEDVRRQIPPLKITGAVYSETPAQRLLLVNNQVLNQGSQAAPEVTLEEIRPKSSVFNFRGTRFRLTN